MSGSGVTPLYHNGGKKTTSLNKLQCVVYSLDFKLEPRLRSKGLFDIFIRQGTDRGGGMG